MAAAIRQALRNIHMAISTKPIHRFSFFFSFQNVSLSNPLSSAMKDNLCERISLR